MVGYIEGNDPGLKDEFVILGAHYDHIGTAKEVNGDVIANGANDDASGTVAVMEWAKYFSQTKTNKRSVLFTLYAAEEMGLKGSGHLAERLKSDSLNVYTMINFEMIGVPRAEGE
ncbi:M20/M25/M40 family metallo-hydrolase [Algibacter lectus]|uniref:Aminopeptidase n=1 Tax=Algibacter lectus TaxID=221126 RepID=A0A090VCA1_9FLAO|nr:aminopeptidase [Algibacter lectus]